MFIRFIGVIAMSIKLIIINPIRLIIIILIISLDFLKFDSFIYKIVIYKL
jgi:hypothetical protein